MAEKPAHPTSGPKDEHLIVLFDGVCNLCNASVAWLIRRDGRGVLRFAALQSEEGREVLRRAGWAEARIDAGAAEPESIVVVDGGRAWERSDAALVVAGRLGLPWSLARVGWVVPRFVRDWVYRWVARNRYRWFGRREACMVPTGEVMGRFLGAGGGSEGVG
jgi:predicted DCC family thiol-disulfide oxidoreductase YuxK